MSNHRRPTIFTVAVHAGVGVSTVSRYLNGRYVSHPTKQRILKAINALSYTRSPIARNLSLGRKGRIGVVVDSSLDPWFVQLLAGIEDELSNQDTSMMLASLHLGTAYDANPVLGWIREKRIDGLIVAKPKARDKALLDAAFESTIPTVTVAPDEAVSNMGHLHGIRCNNVAAGNTVADLLADLGHVRIGFAGGPKHSDSEDRLRGLKDRLLELGIPFDPAHIFMCENWQASAGIELGRIIFAKPLSITALVAANDALALGLMRVAQQRQIQIPQMLSVVGFDNVPEGALIWPGLTTVAQPMREMGIKACKTLFELITRATNSEENVYPMKLIVRESTGPVPGARVWPTSR